MKRFAMLLAAAALACLLCLFAAAKEVTIYENDFSDASALSDFTVRGKWSVSDGKACLEKGTSSSGCLIYRIPSEHAGKKYKVEVDFLGHTGMGGLLINAIQKQDNPVVQAVVLLYAVMGVFGLLLGDIAMAICDPRISLDKKGGSR